MKKKLALLVEHLVANPEIRDVWMNEKGEWWFSSVPGTTKMSSEDVLEAYAAAHEDDEVPEAQQLKPDTALAEEVERHAETIKMYEKQIEGGQAENKELSEANEAFAKENEDLKNSYASLADENNELQKQITTLQEQLTANNTKKK